jgi:hypothetical protein
MMDSQERDEIDVTFTKIRVDRIEVLRTGDPGPVARIEREYGDRVARALSVEDPERRLAALDKATRALDAALARLMKRRLRYG